MADKTPVNEKETGMFLLRVKDTIKNEGKTFF